MPNFLDKYDYDSKNGVIIAKNKEFQGAIYQDIPQFELRRWDNENSIKVRLLEFDISGKIQDTRADRIEFTKNSFSLRHIEVEAGFEFDLVLKTKPSSNVVRYEIQAEDLILIEQPELSQDERNAGDVRPDNVINSFAVYHNSKANNKYQTGKICHIYRFKVYELDNPDKWVWAESKYEKGILSVTIPQKFYNTANYPIVVDPTFGYTTAGGSSSTVYTWMNPFETLTETADISSVVAYVRSSSGTQDFKGLLYTITGTGTNTRPDSKLAVSGAVSIGTSSDWRTFSLTANGVAAQQLAMGTVINYTDANRNRYSYDYDADRNVRYENYNSDPKLTYSDPEETFPTTFNHLQRRASVYANYTASGGAVTSKILMMI
jgi:hypothetical protein